MFRNSRVRRSTQLTLLTFALAAILAGSATAITPSATRYVSPAPVGSDLANTCQLSAAPCATIQHAVQVAAANDTIEVSAGTYEESQIVADKPLALHGAGPGQTIVDGSTSTGQAKDGLLRFDSPAVGNIAVHGITFRGANGENAAGEALTMLFSDVPAGSNVTVSENELVSSEALDPALGGDWSLGIYISSSAAEFEIEGNRFEGMWQGILAERSTGAKKISGNEFANLVANDDGVHTWPGEGILLLAIGKDAGEGEQVSSSQQITNNSFHGYAGLGVGVQSGHPSATPTTPNSFSNVLVRENQIDLGGATFPGTGRPLAGVVLKTGQTDSTIEGAEVLGNTISVTAPGNDVAVEGGVAGTEVHVNRLGGAPAAGLDASLASGSVSAADNWWGCNAGPGAPGCVAKAGAVDSSPNLILTGSASASQLQPGQTATIEASLLRDSDGGSVVSLPSGGEPVLFGSATGSLDPAAGAQMGGLAFSTFTAGPQSGDAGLTVSLDGEKVAVPLTVVAPPPAEPPAPQQPPVVEPPSINPSGAGSPKPVPGNGQIKVAVVGCPVGPCEVEIRGPRVTIGGKSYTVRVKAPGKLEAGRSAAVKVILPKAARDALEVRGKGRIALNITVTSSTGATKTITVTIKLVAKKR
jgi:hypothetical protein